MWAGPRIPVHEKDAFTRRHRNPPVQRSAVAGIRVKFDEANMREPFANQHGGAVGRSGIDDDDLISVADRREGTLQMGARVV